MGYIIAIVILLIVVPLLFIMLSRRTATGGAGIRSRDRGVTVEQPSSDQPTPGAAGSVNQPAPGTEGRLPPG
jgi:hypothetical protein